MFMTLLCDGPDGDDLVLVDHAYGTKWLPLKFIKTEGGQIKVFPTKALAVSAKYREKFRVLNPRVVEVGEL